MARAESAEIRQLLGQRTGRSNLNRAVSEYSEAPSIYSRHFDDDEDYVFETNEPFPFTPETSHEPAYDRRNTRVDDEYSTLNGHPSVSSSIGQAEEARLSVMGPKMKMLSRAPWETDEDTITEQDESDAASMFGGSKKAAAAPKKKRDKDRDPGGGSALAKGLGMATIAGMTPGASGRTSSSRGSEDSYGPSSRKRSMENPPQPPFATLHPTSSSGALPLPSASGPSASTSGSAASKFVQKLGSMPRLRTLSGNARSSPSPHAEPPLPLPSPRSGTFDRSNISSPTEFRLTNSHTHTSSPTSSEFPTRPSTPPNGHEHSSHPNGRGPSPHPNGHNHSPRQDSQSHLSHFTSTEGRHATQSPAMTRGISPTGVSGSSSQNSQRFPDSSSSSSNHPTPHPSARDISAPQQVMAPPVPMAGWGGPGYTGSPTYELLSLEQAQAQARDRRAREAVHAEPVEPTRPRQRSKSGGPSSLANGTSANESKTLAPKRSFMGLFKAGSEAKEKSASGRDSPPPPVPSLPSSRPPMPSRTVPTTDFMDSLGPSASQPQPSNNIKRVPPPSLSVTVTPSAQPTQQTPTQTPKQTAKQSSKQSSRTPVGEGLTVKTSRNAQASSAPPGFTEFQGLQLRPISMNFSNYLPADMLHTPIQSPSVQSGPSFLSNASSYMSVSPSAMSFSSRTMSIASDLSPGTPPTDTTSLLPSLQEQILSSKMVWLSQIAELEAQVRDLKAELEDIKSGRVCVCGAENDTDRSSRQGSEKISVLNRPRPKTGGRGRIVLGGEAE